MTKNHDLDETWSRVADEYREGDIVRGRVHWIAQAFVLIELLPGAALLAPIRELSWRFVRHPRDVVRPKQLVFVKILELDVENRRGLVSLRQAEDDELPVRVDDSELETAAAEAAALTQRLKAAHEQIAQLRKTVRGCEDRIRSFEARVTGDLDPLSSENAFLTALRVEYARRFGENDRLRYPLQRMRIGREFLGRVRDLVGVSVDKVVEVCAQVACIRAHEVAGREVHELHAGDPTAPVHVRPVDGAKAWRCALQINAAAARRLHWWDIPSPHGRTIEFATVGVHDGYSMS